MSIGNRHPELIENEPPTSPLELYLSMKKEMRESKDAILKAHGLTWTAFGRLESDAITEMMDTPIIDLGTHYAHLQSVLHWVHLKQNEPAFVTHRISLHKKGR